MSHTASLDPPCPSRAECSIAAIVIPFPDGSVCSGTAACACLLRQGAEEDPLRQFMGTYKDEDGNGEHSLGRFSIRVKVRVGAYPGNRMWQLVDNAGSRSDWVVVYVGKVTNTQCCSLMRLVDEG